MRYHALKSTIHLTDGGYNGVFPSGTQMLFSWVARPFFSIGCRTALCHDTPMPDAQTQTVPIHVGSRLTMEISDIAFGGEGVARVEDFVVFVPFVIVGEEVEVEVTGVKKR